MADTRMIAASMAGTLAQPRFGLVSAVDPVNHAVKVLVQPSDIETGWLPYAALQVGSLRIACPPDIGAHVLMVPIEADAEHGVAACPIYDAVMMPPISPATGKAAQPGELLVVAGTGAPPASGGAAPGTPAGNAPWWHLTVDAIHSGAGDTTETLNSDGKTWQVGSVGMILDSSGLSITGGSITTDSDITAQGTITGQTDVKAAGISGNSHTHPVTDAPGTTGKPQ
ncbi:phage baseplate assembly protein V [Komagataeibacter diospyri]|uniref:Phage-related baseplate assembly protein n=1 Tax=Komagataeibacter diospyri TaxID=1932662 RepID=A0A4P5NX56_9PROT|nr:phage baseplate assembly protein V [Komagataeibacter diospyri]GCE82512.1 phage-related baseplate assembly protein [Komagataeibacter diospyri]GCE89353.1 phage-related baseplate assembly protein [Komagataeibacter diospyri]